MAVAIRTFAGRACLAGGAGWLALGLAEAAGADDLLGPVASAAMGVAILGCLAAGPLGLLAARAAGSGRAARAGVAGASVALLGLLSYVTSVVAGLAVPDWEFAPAFAALGALLTGVGMLVLGVAVLAARRIEGWRAVAPLLVGLYYAVMIPFQIVFFIMPTGRPSEALLAFWGTTWMLLGRALAAEVRSL